MARPIKINREVVKAICVALSNGHTKTSAAGACKITSTALRTWELRGLKELESATGDQELSIYAELAVGIANALAIDENRCREVLSSIMLNDSLEPRDRIRAAELNLKCRHGWSDKQQLELTGKNGGPVETHEVTDDELKERLAGILFTG